LSTAQLLIVCVTVLALALIVAAVRRRDGKERVLLAQLEASERIRRAEFAPPPRLSPPTGAVLAVHFDGRVVQGTLAGVDDDTLVLTAASAVSGTTTQALGGKQHISRGQVSQVQELS
jgi:hypothetical protein